MSYSAEHKAETRKRIVASARKLFNRRGLSDVSIDEIMADAGLTRGGFYNHFPNKEDLYAEAITQVLQCDRVTADGKPMDVSTPSPALVQEIIAAYLSDSHFNDKDGICSLVAYPSEVARGGESARKAYQLVLESMTGLFEASLREDAKAREKAVTMTTLCVGGMVLARAVNDRSLGDEIRATVMETALNLGEHSPQPNVVAAE